jgi:hypothetical protein
MLQAMAVARETFYIALANALGAAQFKLRPSTASILASERFLPLFMTSIDGALRTEELTHAFDPLRDSTQFLGFKSYLGQPIIAAAIEADSLSPQSLQQTAGVFSACLANCSDFTLKVKGLFSTANAGGVFGYLLCVFFDSVAANRFVGATQKACCISQRKPITGVRAWAIDAPGQRVVSERSSWFNNFLPLNPKKLQSELFPIN